MRAMRVLRLFSDISFLGEACMRQGEFNCSYKNTAEIYK